MKPPEKRKARREARSPNSPDNGRLSSRLLARQARFGIHGPLVCAEFAPPQHSPDAEKGVLGSMAIEPDKAIPVCVEQINENFFFGPAHRIIYRVLVDEYEAERTPDLIVFTQILRDRNLLEKVGGAAFVNELFTFVPTADALQYYIDIVRQKYIARETVQVYQRGIARFEELGDDSPNGILDEVESKILSLRSGIGHNGGLPEAVSLMTFAGREPDPTQTLLGNRFLCRDGGMLFIGPSGIGKSSASVQQDILWGIGREAFGINPARRLRILCIQAENDEGDLTEMVNGVCSRLNLSDKELELARANVIYMNDCSRTGIGFLETVEKLLKKHGPIDILRIDTLHAYLGGDILDPADTARFLRNGLNPILKKFGCAAIVNHHTPKVTNRDTSNWCISDFMYSGAGNADVTNWARAALVIEPVRALPGAYTFHAAKRGGRIGWLNQEGERIYSRIFCWDKGKAICWREATPEDEEQVEAARLGKGKKSGPPKTVEDLMPHVPLEGSIGKNILIERTKEHCGIGDRKARTLVDSALEEGRLFKWEIPRPRTNPEIRISRHKQTAI